MLFFISLSKKITKKHFRNTFDITADIMEN